eukprot:21406-Chlamydomonas_euryale.AAC.1
MKVGGQHIQTSITVLEQKSGPQFIFGLDNLKRHLVRTGPSMQLVRARPGACVHAGVWAPGEGRARCMHTHSKQGEPTRKKASHACTCTHPANHHLCHPLATTLTLHRHPDALHTSQPADLSSPTPLPSRSAHLPTCRPVFPNLPTRLPNPPLPAFAQCCIDLRNNKLQFGTCDASLPFLSESEIPSDFGDMVDSVSEADAKRNMEATEGAGNGETPCVLPSAHPSIMRVPQQHVGPAGVATSLPPPSVPKGWGAVATHQERPCAVAMHQERPCAVAMHQERPRAVAMRCRQEHPCA